MSAPELPPVLEVFAELAHFLTDRLGVAVIPKGVYHEEVDDKWTVLVNTTMTVQSPEDVEIPPLTCVVSYEGGPAGSFGPFGGCLVTWPPEQGVAEEALIDAFRLASGRTRPGQLRGISAAAKEVRS